jgi:hypothetical protein
MKQAKKSVTKEATFVPPIDADVMARINAKIAKAHEQTESPYVFHKSKPPAGTK